MKKFVDFLILFILYVYNNYIYEDWSIYNKAGKIYYYPAWFVRSCLIWLISPIFILEYLFVSSNFYKHAKKILNSPEFNKSSHIFKL